MCPVTHDDVVVPLGPSLSWLGNDMEELHDVRLAENMPSSAKAPESTMVRVGGEVGCEPEVAPAVNAAEAPLALHMTEPCTSPTISLHAPSAAQPPTAREAPLRPPRHWRCLRAWPLEEWDLRRGQPKGGRERASRGAHLPRMQAKCRFVKPHDHREPYRPSRESMEHGAREKMRCVMSESLPADVACVPPV